PGAGGPRWERPVAGCEPCAGEIGSSGEATARLGAAAAAEPPAGLTERALAAAARTRQLPPVTRDAARSWPGRHAAAAGTAGRAARPFRRAWMPRLALAVAGAAVVLAGFLGLAARSVQHQLQQDQSRSHAFAAVLTARDAHMLSARVATGGTATVAMSGR